MDLPSDITADPWQELRRLTGARIALGRSGGSLTTAEVLNFNLAHAAARDAVLAPFDAAALASRIRGLDMEVMGMASAATDRAQYLQRPDLGRRLSGESRQVLTEFSLTASPPDLVMIAADGLSTLAAERQIPPLLEVLLPLLRGAGWQLAPVLIASQARVALQDEIGDILQARLSLILLGERPGLDSADSLGAYFTWNPKPGCTDAARNCLSNIRPAGLPPPAAALRLFHLLTASRRRRLSGTALKDEMPGLQARRD